MLLDRSHARPLPPAAFGRSIAGTEAAVRNSRRAADHWQEGRQASGAAQGAHGRVTALLSRWRWRRHREAEAANAEAELSAMLELEEGAAGSAKGKAKGNKGKRG